MGETAVTIGNFDGVHAGHGALVARSRALVGASGRVVVLAFDPHPSSVLRPGTEPPRLTTFARRTELLRGLGADEVRRLEPDRGLLSLSPEAFMRHVVDSFSPAVLVEGADFHFGKGRAGHVAELREIGARMGFGVEVVEPVEVELCDQSLVTASSSLARWLLAGGRVADAGRVLGRAYELSGDVVSGDRRGRGIGFPTANIEPAETPPAAGVYACTAELPDGRELPAAVHIGERPTIGDGKPRVEAHVLGLATSHGANGPGAGTEERAPSASEGMGVGRDPNEHEHSARRSRSGLVESDASAWAPIDGLDETGWSIRLRFLHWLREPVRFGSLEALAGQLGRDCRRALELVDTAAAGVRREETHA